MLNISSTPKHTVVDNLRSWRSRQLSAAHLPMCTAARAQPIPLRAAAVAEKKLRAKRQCAVQQQRRHLVRAAARAGGDSGAAEPAVDPQLAAIQTAAQLVANQYVRDGMTLGLGTGLAANALLGELARRIDLGALSSITIVPGSDVTASEAAFHGLPLTSLDSTSCHVSLMVDVADELAVDADGALAYVVGRHAPPAPQPQLPRARALAAAADSVVVIAEVPEVVVQRLGGALPVVIEGGEVWETIAEELDDIFLGDAEVWRRSTQPNAGPRGGDSPYVSPEGENILDIRFDDGLRLYGEEALYADISAAIESVQGVVAHGLCVGTADVAVIATPDGPRLVERGGML